MARTRNIGLMRSPSHEPNSDAPVRGHLPLPTELVSDIVTYIRHNQQYATLAKMAQANSAFYDLVISKLYETITITETNWTKVNYGCGYIDTCCASPSAQETASTKEAVSSDVDGDENSAEDGWTRKDRAIEGCLRLIIDLPIYDIVGSIECFADRLPHQRFGRVEEMVITRRGLMNVWTSDKNRILSNILGPASRKKTGQVALTSIPKTKKVILHWPTINETHSSVIIMPQINEWCRHRFEEGRTKTQFVVYGTNLDSRCESMNAECHFFEFRRHSEYGYPRNRESIKNDFACWMIDNLGNGSKVDRVIIHPSAIIVKWENPAEPDDSSSTPRDDIESDLRGQIARIRNLNPAEKVILVASIMSKIVIGDGGYDREEYPVLRPRPVSHLICSHDDGSLIL